MHLADVDVRGAGAAYGSAMLSTSWLLAESEAALSPK